jgi:hypothetical protein
MSKFTGMSCAACRETFCDGDDVVVCPECASPHHRSCYSKSGRCANQPFHGITVKDIIDEYRPAEQNQSEDFEKRNIFGVSKAELSAFMHINRDSLEYKAKIEQIKVININIFAGILKPFYQFYKGMRLLGLLVLIPLFFQLIPYAYTYAQMQEEFLIRFGSTPEQFHSAASTVVTGVMMLLVLFNDYVYLRYSAYKIKKLRLYLPEENQTGSEYYNFLRLKGAPSILRGLVEPLIAFILFIMAMNVLIVGL